MEADTENAHVRKGRRDAPDTQAAESSRLLNDPAFVRAYDRVRDGLLREIEDFRSGGTPEDDAYLMEVCRALRTLKSLRKALSHAEQGQMLRLAEYRSGTVKGEKDAG